MTLKYPVSILNYMVAGNYVHLALWKERRRDVQQEFLSKED